MAHIDRGRCDMRIMVRSILSKGAIRLEILALLEFSKLVVVAIIKCGGTRELPLFFFPIIVRSSHLNGNVHFFENVVQMLIERQADRNIGRFVAL